MAMLRKLLTLLRALFGRRPAPNLASGQLPLPSPAYVEAMSARKERLGREWARRNYPAFRDWHARMMERLGGDMQLLVCTMADDQMRHMHNAVMSKLRNGVDADRACRDEAYPKDIDSGAASDELARLLLADLRASGWNAKVVTKKNLGGYPYEWLVVKGVR